MTLVIHVFLSALEISRVLLVAQKGFILIYSQSPIGISVYSSPPTKELVAEECLKGSILEIVLHCRERE